MDQVRSGKVKLGKEGHNSTGGALFERLVSLYVVGQQLPPYLARCSIVKIRIPNDFPLLKSGCLSFGSHDRPQLYYVNC